MAGYQDDPPVAHVANLIGAALVQGRLSVVVDNEARRVAIAEMDLASGLPIGTVEVEHYIEVNGICARCNDAYGDTTDPQTGERVCAACREAIEGLLAAQDDWSVGQDADSATGWPLNDLLPRPPGAISRAADLRDAVAALRRTTPATDDARYAAMCAGDDALEVALAADRAIDAAIAALEALLAAETPPEL